MTYWNTKFTFKPPESLFLATKIEFQVAVGQTIYGPVKMGDTLVVPRLPPGEYKMLCQFSDGRDAYAEMELAEGVNIYICVFNAVGYLRRVKYSLKSDLITIKLERVSPDIQDLLVERGDKWLPSLPQKTSQFWAGHCDDPDLFYQILYDCDYCELSEAEQAKTPNTIFAQTQGKLWVDMYYVKWCFHEEEWDLDGKATAPENMFSAHPSSEVWLPILGQWAKEKGLKAMNCMIMVEVNDFSNLRKISVPLDIKYQTGSLKYIGEITHDQFLEKR